MSRRTEARRGYSDSIRLDLLEGDMDEVAEAVQRIMRLLISTLVSLATAAVLLAANLVFGG